MLHCRFEAMLHVMQKGMPDTQIIIQAIYPRGADFAANSFQWPNHFTYPIDLLNALYQASDARTCAQHVHIRGLLIKSQVLHQQKQYCQVCRSVWPASQLKVRT